MSTEVPLDEDEFRRWRAEADRALAGARAQDDLGIHNWACFGAEQAAQLAVKALLHGIGTGPWSHDLTELGKAARLAGITVPPLVDDALRRLSRHHIAARYPDAHPSGGPGAHYGASDAEQAIDDAEVVLPFVDDAWGALPDDA